MTPRQGADHGGQIPDRLAEALRTEYERQRDAGPPPAWSTIAGHGVAPTPRRRQHPLLAVVVALLFVAVPALALGIARLPHSAGSTQNAQDAPAAAGVASSGAGGSAHERAQAARSAAPGQEKAQDLATASSSESWGVPQLTWAITSAHWQAIVIVDGAGVTVSAPGNPPTYAVARVRTQLRGSLPQPFTVTPSTPYTTTELAAVRTLPDRLLLMLQPVPRGNAHRIVGMFAVHGDIATQVWPRTTRAVATFTLTDLRTAIAAARGPSAAP